jgi:hypothetical protein
LSQLRMCSQTMSRKSGWTLDACQLGQCPTWRSFWLVSSPINGEWMAGYRYFIMDRTEGIYRVVTADSLDSVMAMMPTP